ncbi:MAG: hypothetical protein MRQ11_00980 [Candidatus Midichloria mitochondrii]|nr:hypothetical protein [Candidatus Midichloria mitochondrii]MDJ1287684.1 hypothetical protein [Candidatus Midichloria mitochondrii]MDJ1298547.1 hypothetical protein [Candidatus Midichloria mitochondrii]MDJ1312696.1 hypothetical protein [Candidatus Midichloria mitochondrii]MDJ1583267.1 hypothetical protein [Candidatus Midichloria mitochondrii]
MVHRGPHFARRELNVIEDRPLEGKRNAAGEESNLVSPEEQEVYGSSGAYPTLSKGRNTIR